MVRLSTQKSEAQARRVAEASSRPDGAALRARYLELVAERRAGLDLSAEIAEARGEFLLVCPARLGER